MPTTLKPYAAERQTFPYWKVQLYRPDQLAWFDIQKQHTTRTAEEAAAQAEQAKGKTARLMRIDRTGRTPEPLPT